MQTLYLSYNESRSGGYPLDDEPYSEREDEVIDITWLGVTLDKDSSGFLREELKCGDRVKVGDKVYVVIVRYSDGDTFGTTSGCFHIMEGRVYKDRRLAEDQLRMANESRTRADLNMWYPWHGYFAQFESAEIHEFVVN